jgi:seryl-tRNA synthetase
MTSVDPLIADFQEDYLRKTIEVKNRNIDELLRELKETQEVYQTYKNEYLSEEKKMKDKIAGLGAQVEGLTREVEKYKAACQRLRSELQTVQEKEHQNREQQLAMSK